MIDVAHVLHQGAFGAIAAIGFGVLFNFGFRSLLWAGAAGALALATRTILQSWGWTLEASSFVAALATAALAYGFVRRLGASTNAVALAGCIPMVPGAFFGTALLSFLAVTTPGLPNADATLLASLEAFLRVVFTLGAIGAGLAIPSHLIGHRGF